MSKLAATALATRVVSWGGSVAAMPETDALYMKMGLGYEDLVNQHLSSFEKENAPGCTSAEFGTALENARELVRTALVSYPGYFELTGLSAKVLLDVADAARRHECKDVAEKLYDFVVETYVGLGCDTYRQRATIALTRLSVRAGHACARHVAPEREG